MIDLTTLTDAGLHDLSARIAAEWDRRRATAVTDQAVTEVITGLQDSGKLPAPASGTDTETAEPWADPGTAHSSMYRQGVYVTHQGKTWLNTHPTLNHWPPGTLNGGWLDVTPAPIDEETGEPQIIAWGGGPEGKPGDLRTHDGQTGECRLGHSTHAGGAPGPATHAVWTPAEPEPPGCTVAGGYLRPWPCRSRGLCYAPTAPPLGFNWPLKAKEASRGKTYRAVPGGPDPVVRAA